MHQFRSGRAEDRDLILAIHRDAFGRDGDLIASLVETMLRDPSAEPLQSFVIAQQGQLVGHVLFSSVRIESHGEVSARILAPLAVVPDQHGKGLGTRLTKDAFESLQASGVELVFVLGYPSFYTRLGFVPAGACGLEAPYPILPKNADAWMVKELQPGAIANCKGTVRCCAALDHPRYWQE